MKVQVWKVLIVTAIDHQSICAEMVVLNQMLDGGVQIVQKCGMDTGVERRQRGDFGPGDNDDMIGMRWRRVPKGQQGVCFKQARYGNDKGHVTQYPNKQTVQKSPAQQCSRQAKKTKGQSGYLAHRAR